MTKPVTKTPSLDCCDFHVVPSDQPAVSETLSYYERMRAYVEHEDDLISSRLTWSLTVHGFLFAVYGLLLGKAADMFIELHRLVASASPKLLERPISGLFFFQLPVALLGVFVGLYSREAIVGAHNAIQHVCAIAHASGALQIRPDRSVPAAIARGERPILLPKIIDGGAPPSHRTSSYYLRLPLIMMGVWIFLFIASVTLCLLSLFARCWFFCPVGRVPC